MQKTALSFLLLLAAGTPACVSYAQPEGGHTKRALLIGINIYQPSGTKAQHPPGCPGGGRCDLPVFKNLDGPVNDVAAMRDLLSSPRFGFAPENIAVLTNPGLPASKLPYKVLPAAQTSHDGLLAVMREYLLTVPKPGDTVVFYYAGHGSLRVNSKGTKLSVLVNGVPSHADSTLVPSDAWKGIHDVRDREMTDIFNKALDNGVKLTVLLDSCHSGSFTRGVELGPQYTERLAPFDPVDIDEAPEMVNGKPKPAPSQRDVNPALVFSAAQQDQTAKEKEFGDKPGSLEVHGAFTLALIQALQTLPANAPASAVYRQVRATIEGEGVADQTPSLDASKARLEQPLFGGEKSENGKIRAAVIGVDSDGRVLLDAGQIAGIDVGSQFTFPIEGGTGNKVKLEVESQQGVTLSRAKVLVGQKEKIVPGQVFELTRWVPRQVDTLQFWTWPANLPLAKIQSAMEQVKASRFDPVEDPVEQPWTDMLAWNGTQWELRHAARSADEKAVTTPLGPDFSSAELKKILSPAAKLWANLPPPTELYAKLALHEKNSLVAETKDAASADYLLAGTFTEDGPKWAWFHKVEYMDGPRAAVTRDHSPGCSTTSGYPVSTDWTLLQSSVDDTAADLNKYATRLAKVNGWLNLAKNPSGASDDNFYKLVFKRTGDGSVLSQDVPAKQDESLKMYLTSDSRVSQSRWVYVLDINCQGKGTLLYPDGTSDNRFPNDADSPHRDLELPGAPGLHIGAPYGVDTVLFITTQEQLPDADALNFDGVGTRSMTRGAANPLQQLLGNTSAGTRGPVKDVPTGWSIEPIPLQSVPATAN